MATRAIDQVQIPRPATFRRRPRAAHTMAPEPAVKGRFSSCLDSVMPFSESPDILLDLPNSLISQDLNYLSRFASLSNTPAPVRELLAQNKNLPFSPLGVCTCRTSKLILRGRRFDSRRTSLDFGTEAGRLRFGFPQPRGAYLVDLHGKISDFVDEFEELRRAYNCVRN